MMKCWGSKVVKSLAQEGLGFKLSSGPLFYSHVCVSFLQVFQFSGGSKLLLGVSAGVNGMCDLWQTVKGASCTMTAGIEHPLWL